MRHPPVIRLARKSIEEGYSGGDCPAPPAEDFLNRAALVLQKYTRSFLGKVVVGGRRTEEKRQSAARTLQKYSRGSLTRLSFQGSLGSPEKNRVKQSVIQWSGYLLLYSSRGSWKRTWIELSSQHLSTRSKAASKFTDTILMITNNTVIKAISGPESGTIGMALSGCKDRLGHRQILQVAGTRQKIANLCDGLVHVGAWCGPNHSQYFGAPRKRSVLLRYASQRSLGAHGLTPHVAIAWIASHLAYVGGVALVLNCFLYHAQPWLAALAFGMYSFAILLSPYIGNGTASNARASLLDISMAAAAGGAYALILLAQRMWSVDEVGGEYTILVHLVAFSLELYAVLFTFGLIESEADINERTRLSHATMV
eukprot:scaffold103963_cov37-Tisochrysis_lutea.AAC.1